MFTKGHKHSEETKKKMSIVRKGMNTWSKGRKHTEETRKKMSLVNKGRVPWIKGKHHSPETRMKMSKRMKNTQAREGNYNWQGGKSYEPYSVDWTKTLRRSIRERDHYVCQLCRKEPSISVHHIDYDKKNCNPNNLITLCNSCNSKVNIDRDYWTDYFTKIITKFY